MFVKMVMSFRSTTSGPRNLLEYVIKKEPGLLFGSGGVESLPAFWHAYNMYHSGHRIFSDHHCFDRIIPLAIHGDEGRGKRRSSTTVVFCEAVLGVKGKVNKCSCHPTHLDSYQEPDDELHRLAKALQCNLKGHSFLQHFPLFVIPGIHAKQYKDITLSMLELIADDLKDLYENGMDIGGDKFHVAIVASKGDLKWHSKICRFYPWIRTKGSNCWCALLPHLLGRGSRPPCWRCFIHSILDGHLLQRTSMDRCCWSATCPQCCAIWPPKAGVHVQTWHSSHHSLGGLSRLCCFNNIPLPSVELLWCTGDRWGQTWKSTWTFQVVAISIKEDSCTSEFYAPVVQVYQQEVLSLGQCEGKWLCPFGPMDYNFDGGVDQWRTPGLAASDYANDLGDIQGGNLILPTHLSAHHVSSSQLCFCDVWIWPISHQWLHFIGQMVLRKSTLPLCHQAKDALHEAHAAGCERPVG